MQTYIGIVNNHQLTTSLNQAEQKWNEIIDRLKQNIDDHAILSQQKDQKIEDFKEEKTELKNAPGNLVAEGTDIQTQYEKQYKSLMKAYQSDIKKMMSEYMALTEPGDKAMRLIITRQFKTAFKRGIINALNGNPNLLANLSIPEFQTEVNDPITSLQKKAIQKSREILESFAKNENINVNPTTEEKFLNETFKVVLNGGELPKSLTGDTNIRTTLIKSIIKIAKDRSDKIKNSKEHKDIMSALGDELKDKVEFVQDNGVLKLQPKGCISLSPDEQSTLSKIDFTKLDNDLAKLNNAIESEFRDHTSDRQTSKNAVALISLMGLVTIAAAVMQDIGTIGMGVAVTTSGAAVGIACVSLIVAIYYGFTTKSRNACDDVNAALDSVSSSYVDFCYNKLEEERYIHIFLMANKVV